MARADWNQRMYEGKVIGIQTFNAIKDVAIEVGIASGEADVFIDLDTVGDRMPERDSEAIRQLREIIAFAHSKGADFIHLY